MSTDLSAWWADLTAAAVVGTARRQVPPLPEVLSAGRDDAGREVLLLDAAALGGALRRAGMRAHEPEPVAPADDDRRTLPPQRATQLLELLLHQSPVGATLMPDLVQVWLDAAVALGHRAPHHLLPELLELAARHEGLRSGVSRVGDRRAAWLAAANPDWRWLTGEEALPGVQPDEMAAESWARLPTDQREAEVARLRTSDPSVGRRLVESTWSTDTAGERVRLLSALRVGIGPDDEPLLERALEDRSVKVRELAVTLLDGLPGSARAARMADRLRPLLTVKGMLRRTLEVELPVDPDPDGVRDGLTRPKRVGSVRGWWLQRLAAGAPLDVWTEATSSDPAGAWRMVTQRDARAGIVEAVLARRDSAWASAIVADVWHSGLLSLLPTEQLDAAAAQQVATTTPEQLIIVVAAVPAPWGPAFSRAVLQRLKAEKEPTILVTQLTIRLATGLDPVTRPALDKWAAGLEPGARERVARISQYLALVPEIPEAFR